MSSSQAVKRLQKELSDILHAKHKEVPENVSIGPKNEGNMFLWNATIIGAKDTAYEGGIFELEIQIPSSYPFRPPKVHFKTKIFHPNINDKGDICLDILKSKWEPSLNLTQVMISILSLMSDPNPLDPFNTTAATIYKENRSEYNAVVREYINIETAKQEKTREENNFI
jgi:ubiquitin-conjugating enzyme E2 D/E